MSHRSLLRTALASLLSVLALPAAALGQASSPPAAPAPPKAPASDQPAAQADLPSAESLCKRHVEALGGEAAVKAITRMTTKGVFEAPTRGIKAPTSTYMAEPELLLTEMDLPDYGNVRTGYNGSIGWSIDPSQGPRILAGKELEQIRRDADAKRDLTLLRSYDSVKVIGLGDYGGEPCFEVRCTGPDGDTTYFFEKSSGLVRGFHMTTVTALGAVDVETVFLEYKAFEGPGGPVKLPVRSAITMMKNTQILSVDSVSFAEIDAKQFELPKEIQALVRQQEMAAPKPAEKAPAPTGPSPPSGGQPTQPSTPKADEKPAGEPK